MRFLIDGHRDRVTFRREQWEDGVVGQLLTPLTNYKLGHQIFGVDNGAFSSLKIRGLSNLLNRNRDNRHNCLFVAIPDKVGCHRTTQALWDEYHVLADGWAKAFVAQDGYDGAPDDCDAVFIGGTDAFKDSDEVLEIVAHFLRSEKHVHIGRVNGPARFMRFHDAGAHTCDGSGVSRYDYMLPAIRVAMENR